MSNPRKGRLSDIDPADLGSAVLVTVGTPAAAEHFPGDEKVSCDHCGAPLRHVFVCSGGYNLGGDCLASLTGDDSTRSAIVRLARKHAGKGITRVYTMLGAVLGRTANDRTVLLMSRPTYMDNPRALEKDLHPKHREQAERLAAGLAEALGAELTTRR